jgi:hypothetical protein
MVFVSKISERDFGAKYNYVELRIRTVLVIFHKKMEVSNISFKKRHQGVNPTLTNGQDYGNLSIISQKHAPKVIFINLGDLKLNGKFTHKFFCVMNVVRQGSYCVPLSRKKNTMNYCTIYLCQKWTVS